MNFIRFYGFCLVGPTKPQRDLQGRPLFCLSRPPSHHHLLWWFEANTVTLRPWFWSHSTPLLPGSVFEPFVWPLNLWTPPYLAPHLCPITASVIISLCLFLCFLAYSGQSINQHLLIIVQKTQRNQVGPLWTPHSSFELKNTPQSTKVNCGCNKHFNCLFLGLK